MGVALSTILFVLFMDRISRHSQGREGLPFGGLGISSLLFRIMWSSCHQELKVRDSVDCFTVECEMAGMRVSTSKSEAMEIGRAHV